MLGIDPSAMESILVLMLGFAFAGVLASGFEVVTARQAGFSLLKIGGLGALASVPLVVFSAPFLIVRNTIRGNRIERRPVHFVMLSTIIAGVWSLACGRLVMDLTLRLLTA